MKITIFGMVGTGTTTIGKLLADELKCDFYSTGDEIRKKAKDMGMGLQEYLQYLQDNPEIDLELDEFVKKLSKKNNNFVCESRLAWKFAVDSFKIKLTAEFDVRRDRIKFRDDLLFDEATIRIKDRDEKDSIRYRELYKCDFPPKDDIFDLVIDTTKLLPDEIIDRILEVLPK